MRKLFSLLIFSCLGLVAQQRNTVYLQLATGLPIGTLPPQSYLITNNVGQTFHNFAVTERSTDGTSNCNDVEMPFNFLANIQVSYDGFNYTQIANSRISYSIPIVNTPYKAITKLYRASGAYPYIRLLIQSFPTAFSASACRIDISYTGSLQGTPISDASNTLQMASGSGTLIPNNTCTNIPAGITALNTSNTIYSSLALVGVNYYPLSANTTLTVYAGIGCTNMILPITSFTGDAAIIPTDTVNLTPLGYGSPTAASAFSVKITGTGTGGGYAYLFYALPN